jgi:hypothetical protein
VRLSTQKPLWILEVRQPYRIVGWFLTPGEAIDHAYKKWPYYL